MREKGARPDDDDDEWWWQPALNTCYILGTVLGTLHLSSHLILMTA